MKTKQLLLLAGVLLAAIAVWGGRVAWRVHHQLVTIDVRNAPLAEVLRKVEKQTWTKIRAEQALDARITLHVKDKTLSYALNRIAEQAGARWSTVYAVYTSSSAVSALESTLRGDGKLDDAGWTKIAPNAADFKEGGKGGPADHLRINPKPDESGPLDSQVMPAIPPGESGPIIEKFAGGPPPEISGPGEGPRRRVVALRDNNGPVMFFGGPAGEMEMWSPEELVLESALKPRVGSPGPHSASAQSATDTARKVGGRWTTFLAFRKSNMGVGFVGLPPAPREGGFRGAPVLEPGPHNPNQRFVTLTPAQRVQRARERVQWKEKTVATPDTN